MRRRLIVIVLLALALLGLAWWAGARDGEASARGWSPPRLAVGRDASPRGAVARADGAELGYGIVACTVDEAWGDEPGRLVARSEAGDTAMSADGALPLTLHLAPGEWEVSWHGGGTGRGAQLRRLGVLDVEAGQVHRCAVPVAGWAVSGNVLDSHGEPRVGDRVEGCGAHTVTDEAGLFTLQVTRGDCLVRAWTSDGLLHRPSEPLYVDVFDLPVSPTLRVDASAIGGVGLGLRSAADGLHVTMVAAGSPAEAADLVVGDVVAAVNGASAAGWSVVQGIEAITGEPGTRVRLRIRGADGTGEADVDLVRERLEAEPASSSADTGRR